MLINGDQYPFFVKDVFILEETKAPDQDSSGKNKEKTDPEFFGEFQTSSLYLRQI